MLQVVAKWGYLIYGMQQISHEILRNAEAETTECYEMIY